MLNPVAFQRELRGGGAVQWRLWQLAGEFQQLVAHSSGGIVHRRGHVARQLRSTCDTGTRQLGITQLNLDGGRGDAKNVGSGLRQDGIGPGADISTGALHHKFTLWRQDDFCLSRQFVDRIGARGHAPANQFTPFAH